MFIIKILINHNCDNEKFLSATVVRIIIIASVSRDVLQTNTAKLKLLVRSHAMRESTSPPREPHGGNGSSSPHSPQSADGEKRIVCSLSPNSNGAKLNNNESMYNSNLCPAQSPKQMRNTATSPTCRAPSRNGETSARSLSSFSP